MMEIGSDEVPKEDPVPNDMAGLAIKLRANHSIVDNFFYGS